MPVKEIHVPRIGVLRAMLIVLSAALLATLLSACGDGPRDVLTTTPTGPPGGVLQVYPWLQLEEQIKLAEQPAIGFLAWRHHRRQRPRHSPGPPPEQTERAGAAGVGQPRQPLVFGPQLGPIEWGHTAGVGQPPQPKTAVPRPPTC